jgi:hypothetical protein
LSVGPYVALAVIDLYFLVFGPDEDILFNAWAPLIGLKLFASIASFCAGGKHFDNKARRVDDILVSRHIFRVAAYCYVRVIVFLFCDLHSDI